MTKFKDFNDPGYQSICAVLRRWISDYERFKGSHLGSAATTSPEETGRSRPPWPPRTDHLGPLPNYTVNNSGGGMIVQGNTVNGPMIIGK
jgi:hypothetical protein